jgi:hypothetical protein
MQNYEYRVEPAPRKPKSGKGVRGTPAKFANAVSILMNEMAALGWDYVRADTLPCEERKGLRGKTTTYHSMLVFRRAIAAPEAAIPVAPVAAAAVAAAPAMAEPQITAPQAQPDPAPAPIIDDVANFADEPMVSDPPLTAPEASSEAEGSFDDGRPASDRHAAE